MTPDAATAQIVYDFEYVGPHTVGQAYLGGDVTKAKRHEMGGKTHDPMTLPNCEKELMKARATARFAGGLGKTLLSHPNRTAMPA